jgi:hypothetical protein
MLKEYVVDAARVPWKSSETEGLTFQCQVLLSGDDGGPEALRFRFDPTAAVYAHMHLTSQFQLLIAGGMDMPRGSMSLRPVSIHYTDHNTPYGPFSCLPGHDMLVLHPKSGGLISMAHIDARRKINLGARLLVAHLQEAHWCAWPDMPGSRLQTLIPADMGPEALALDLAPNMALPTAPATYGRYEVVLSGSVQSGGSVLTAPGFRHVRGDEAPAPLIAGPEGARLMLMSFDADALEGGLTGEGIAVTAAQAMARAI